MEALQTSVETLDKERVKLRVEVPEAALGPAVDAAYRRWASDLKIPGFRKGKVPRSLIDSRLGPGAVREEALRDALPDLYVEALRSENIEAIAAPDIELVTLDPLVFEATVDVRPEIELPDLGSITVEAASREVADADVDEQLERLRDRFSELEPTAREARRGDYVLIDLKAYENDELVEGMSAPDFLYEVGSRSGPPRLDEELEGTRPGAILKFSETVAEGDYAGRDVAFTVLVKEVKSKRLPSLDDEFAKTVGEFESLDELRTDLKLRLGDVKRQWADDQTRSAVLTALVDHASFEAPEKLVDAEMEHRLEHLEADLKEAGLTLDDYAGRIQLTELEIRRDLREQAGRSVKAELILEEIARRESIEVTDEDIARHISVMAARVGKSPNEIAEQLVQSRRLNAVAADIMRRKALDFAVQGVNLTGQPVDEEEDGPAESAQADAS